MSGLFRLPLAIDYCFMLRQPCVEQSAQPWMVTHVSGWYHVLTDPCAHQLRLRGDDSTKSSRMLETLDGFVALHVTRKAQHRSSRPQSIRSNQCPARLMPFLFAPSISEVQRCACLRGTGGVESPRQLWLLDSQGTLFRNRSERTSTLQVRRGGPTSGWWMW